MSIPWEEHELEELRLLKEQGTAVVGEFYSRYQGQLTRMIQVRLDRRLCGRIDPADVLQEAYLEVSQRLDRYLVDPSVPLVVWLRQVVSQTLIDLHRRHLGAKKRDARQEISIHRQPDALVTSESLAAQLVGDATSPSQIAVREETLAELRHALDGMEPIDREILALRHFEDLSNNDVAKILGLHKSAASNRYVRALKRLQQILAKMAKERDRPVNPLEQSM